MFVVMIIISIIKVLLTGEKVLNYKIYSFIIINKFLVICVRVHQSWPDLLASLEQKDKYRSMKPSWNRTIDLVSISMKAINYYEHLRKQSLSLFPKRTDTNTPQDPTYCKMTIPNPIIACLHRHFQNGSFSNVHFHKAKKISYTLFELFSCIFLLKSSMMKKHKLKFRL